MLPWLAPEMWCTYVLPCKGTQRGSAPLCGPTCSPRASQSGGSEAGLRDLRGPRSRTSAFDPLFVLTWSSGIIYLNFLTSA